METYVVTGANAGIGRAIVEQLAQDGYEVTMVCRDPQKGLTAQRELQSSTGNNNITLITGDLSNNNGVRSIAKQLIDQSIPIAALINNAALMSSELTRNDAGIEMSFAVNHLAPFLLTNLLVKATTVARVVNVNAGLYVSGQVDLKQLPTGENFNGMQTYASTKLCNILFTRQLAKRLKDTGSTTTVNAVHPGVVRTTLGDRAGFLGFVIKVAKRFWKAPSEGARGPVYLATSPDVAGVTGCYYDGLKQKPYADVALDDRLAQELWDLSATLTEL